MKQRQEKLKAQQLHLQQQNYNDPTSPSPIATLSTPTAATHQFHPLSPNDGSASSASVDSSDSPIVQDDTRHILLCACGANEILPLNPELPADLFTSCLTTPIRMALRWFASRSLLINVTIK